MSSNEEDFEESQLSKKRRVQRACDICRRKKIRCDGGQMPESRCSNCIACSYDCTYVEAAKKRGPSKSYVEKLESRIQSLEALINQICPNKQIFGQLNETLARQNEPLSICGNVHPTKGLHDLTKDIIRVVNTSIPLKSNLGPPVDEDDEDEIDQIKSEFNRMQMQCGNSVLDTFVGKSSALSLLKSTFEARDVYAGIKGGFNLRQFREEFWMARPWELRMRNVESVSYDFPPPDLLTSLSELYFSKVNFFLPLLHQPSFEGNIRAGLHHTDGNFAEVVLLVCALGSLYSVDGRVKLDGVESWHSAGWKWFDQIKLCQRPVCGPVTLSYLQSCCLYSQFVQSSSAPQCGWSLVGIGIRLAQDVGAHRQKKLKNKRTLGDELWKRAFWILVAMDRMMCAGLGRPCAIQDEDFDVDFPIECDDEYWVAEDDGCPSEPVIVEKSHFIPKHPPDKPSLVTAFVIFLKLTQVLALVLRTIYSIKKSKILLGFVGSHWEQHIVSELDSTLNHWVDLMPDHLRWDPTREYGPFFTQSTILYCIYYHVQILVHRPFIPTPGKPSTTSFPSLAICTNAARACSHVIDVGRMNESMVLPCMQMAVSSAGFILLLNIWGGRKSGLSSDPSKEMVDVHKCMHALKVCEARWHMAGKIWDIFYELLSAGDLPLPPSPPLSNKRGRDCESPSAYPSPSSFSSNDSANFCSSPSNELGQKQRYIHSETRRITAGSQRVTQKKQRGSDRRIVLPMYSNELGGYPLSQSQSQSHWLPRSEEVPIDVPVTFGIPQGPEPRLTKEQLRSSASPVISTPPYSAMFHDGASYSLAPGTGGEANDFNFPMQNIPASVLGLAVEDPFLRGMHTQVSRLPEDSSATSEAGADLSPSFLNGLVSSEGLTDSTISMKSPLRPGLNLNAQSLMDQDMFAMLSSFPSNLEFLDWGGYLANTRDLPQWLPTDG